VDSEFYDDHDQGFSKGIKALSDQVIPICYMSEVIPSIPGLEEGMDAGMRILDIGCGSGLLMVELAKAFPNCIFVGVDVDKFAVEDAHRRIKENSVEDRVCAQLIDAVSIDYDGEFDLVNLAVTLHEINPKIRDRSMANCFRALKDSGQIVILERIIRKDWRISESQNTHTSFWSSSLNSLLAANSSPERQSISFFWNMVSKILPLSPCLEMA